MPPYPVAASRNRNFGVAPSFAGAYDAIPSITAAYGMRRLRTAYTGSILRIRRSSDNTESNIGYTADGHLDTAAVATFIGGGSGYIVTWYDQSGNGYNATQTTAASQPLYVASGQNGRPVGRWDGVNDTLSLGISVLSGLTGLLLSAVVIPRSAGEEMTLYSGNNRTQYTFQYYATGALFLENGGFIYETFLAGTYPANVAHIISMDKTGAANITRKNGTQIRSDSSIATLSVNTPDYIGSTGSAKFAQIDIAELIICNAALSDANRGAAEAASNAYWAVY